MRKAFIEQTGATEMAEFDGKIILMESGEEVKEWNVKDRIGFFVAKREGFRLAWITGRKSRQVEARAAEVGVDVLRQHADHKGLALEESAAEAGVRMEETLFIGDDLVDLPNKLLREGQRLAQEALARERDARSRGVAGSAEIAVRPLVFSTRPKLTARQRGKDSYRQRHKRANKRAAVAPQ